MGLRQFALAVGGLITILVVLMFIVPDKELSLGAQEDTVDVAVEKNTPREALQITATKPDGETTYVGSYDYLKFTISALDEQMVSLQAKRDYYQSVLTIASQKFDAADVPAEGTKFSTTTK